MFVTSTDFDFKPYQIPNLMKVINSFNAFVTSEERKLLEKVLGYELCSLFYTGLAADPIDPKWSDLRDGKEYTNGADKLNKYAGIKSLMIPYIYSQWLRATFDNHSEVGVNIANVENSEIISPATRIVNAFNDCAKQVGGRRLRKHWGFEVPNVIETESSMLGFLMANADDYPELDFKPLELINTFDF